MKVKLHCQLRLVGWLLLLIALCAQTALAQTTAFTYQGRLTDGGNPANGNYDLQFALFDNSSGGTQIGSTLSRSSIAVSGGVFTVQLDFGVSAFPGAGRFLEIGVKPSAGGSFTILSPRQQISSTPYAIRTLSAATADTASNANQLGGVAANQYVQTNDSRLSDARAPTAGSANYIQSNPPGTQSGANFNISGNGAAAGTLSGNVINATAQYNLGGNRILSMTGSDNLFAGLGAGQTNTTGLQNVFFGTSAGQALTSGSNNSFFGNQAGLGNAAARDNAFFGNFSGAGNTSGNGNSYFGAQAGQSAKGANNSFFGYAAGFETNAGSSNTFIGANAGNLQNSDLSFATALGYNAKVICDHCMVLGDPADDNLTVNVGSQGLSLLSGGKVAVSAQDATAFYGKNSSTNINNATAFFRNVANNGYAGVFHGKVLIGDPNGAIQLTVQSIPSGLPHTSSVCFNVAGDILDCNSSSLRYKTNVRPFLSGLDVVRQLRPISFNWKRNGEADFGLAAEEVQAVAPSLTYVTNGELTGVKYDRLNMLLINAIKEQQKEIEQLRKEIRHLHEVTRQRANRRLQNRER